MEVKNQLVDAAILPDGRVATVEGGRAFSNFWQYSGFSGHGYLVCVNGEPVKHGQVAMRRDALRLLVEMEAKPLHEQTRRGMEVFAA